MSFDIITESAPSPLQIALSPDGARLAAFANTPQGNPIWLRRLDEVVGQTLPVQITELDKARGDTAHRHPKFLPDGQHFIFFVVSGKPENSGLYLGSLESKASTRLVPSDSMGLFAPPDHLLFTRSSTLMAQRFDARRLELQGDPFPVAQDVGINTENSVSGVAVSDTGVLAYRIGGGIDQRVLRWVDREGKPLGDVGGASSHENATLAPDGERLAETRLEVSTADIWTVDLVRGSSSRFTFDPAIDDNAIWSPDGGRLVFGSTRAGGVRNLYIKSAAGAGQDELLLNTDGSKYPTDWSRDGGRILFTEAKGSQDVWVLPMSGDKKPIPFLQTPFNESRARFSPDGRWIAYTSDEGGVLEIYVQPFPPSGGKWQISTSGGVEPHWRGDGRELFYNLGGAIWAVEVMATESTSFKAGVPRKLFDAGITSNPFITRYDVAPDGKRFLLNLNRAAANVVPSIRVVLNWTTGVGSRANRSAKATAVRMTRRIRQFLRPARRNPHDWRSRVWRPGAGRSAQ